MLTVLLQQPLCTMTGCCMRPIFKESPKGKKRKRRLDWARLLIWTCCLYTLGEDLNGSWYCLCASQWVKWPQAFMCLLNPCQLSCYSGTSQKVTFCPRLYLSIISHSLSISCLLVIKKWQKVHLLRKELSRVWENVGNSARPAAVLGKR